MDILEATEKKNDQPVTVHNVRRNIVGIDVEVPLLDGTMRPYTNLDNAASTPVLRPVLDTVVDFMSWYSSVHRGAGFKSQVSTSIYDQAHDIACDFVKADPETNAVIFGRNATDSLNKLARRFPFQEGDVVITTLMEHHSNDLPWRKVARVVHVHVDDEGALDENHLENLLQQYAGKVKLVVVSGASNVTGYINPIHRIAEKVHAAGAEIVVDAAQLAPHRVVDMRPDDDPQHLDFVVLAAHKMYAPFGASALIGRKNLFLDGDPDIVGGGTVDIVTVEDVKWTGLPDREEAGSPNVPGAVAQAKTMLCLQQIGMEDIAAHEAELTAYLLKKLKKLDRITLYGSKDEERTNERVGVVPFTMDRVSHYKVAAILSAEGGIAVRNGCFCAHPYLFQLLKLNQEQAGRYRSQIIDGCKAELPGLVRVSLGCYNNAADVDWLVEMLERITRGAYQGQYRQDLASGEYHPEGFQVDTASYFRLE